MTLEDLQIQKFTFSGHDSFQCRQLWLKKGYDFLQNGGSFRDEEAVVKLGVGKNMVSSIRYWMKAFNIIDQADKPTKFGTKLLDNEKGYDPFLEDEASLWLLHYQLIANGLASTYSIIFNKLRKEKIYFNSDSYLNFLKREQENNTKLNLNERTVIKDFNTFINTYKTNSNKNQVDDSLSGILSELELLKIIGNGNKLQIQIENSNRDNLPEEILLFTILDNNNYGNSISLNSLEFDVNSPGIVFALNRSALVNKISQIVKDNKFITFTDHAGVKELQFKNKPNSYSILDTYYGK